MNAGQRGAGLLVACALGVAAAALSTMPQVARAEEIQPDLAARLTPAQQRAYVAYRTARSKFEREHRAYWSSVEAKRDVRKAKRIMRQAFEADDYVQVQPPKYQGPELPPDIARIVTEMRPPWRKSRLPPSAISWPLQRRSSASCPSAPRKPNSSASMQAKPSRSA